MGACREAFQNLNASLSKDFVGAGQQMLDVVQQNSLAGHPGEGSAENAGGGRGRGRYFSPVNIYIKSIY